MNSTFETLKLEDAQLYNTYWEECQEKSADYTFVNLWTWAEFHRIKIKSEHNLIWIKDKHGFFRAPIGNWETADWENMEELKQGMTFHRVPQQLLDILIQSLGDRVTYSEDKNNAEYVYLREDLAFLKGNKFHKKKNHVNNYFKNYPDDYRSFTGSTATSDIVDSIIALQNIWCEWHGCDDDPSLYGEYEGIRRILRDFAYFPQLVGGGLYIDGKMIAFALGEKLDDQTLVVHFEKGHPEYKTVYQAINKTFAEHAGTDYLYINREQDLGNEGLRKAKESYQPVHLLNKYTVNISKENQ